MCFYTIFPTKISDCKSTKFFNTNNINKNNFFSNTDYTDLHGFLIRHFDRR